MKKIYMILILGLFSARLMAQAHLPDYSKKDSINRMKDSLKNDFLNNKTSKDYDAATKAAIQNNPHAGKGDERSMNPVLLGFLSSFGTDGKNDLVFNPTLYSLISSDHKLDTIKKYRENTLLRNISLLAGISPDPKDQLHINDALWGFKWVIINNKILKESDYIKASEKYSDLLIRVNEYVHNLPNHKRVIDYLKNRKDSLNKSNMSKDTVKKDLVNPMLTDKDKDVQNAIKSVSKQFKVDDATAADLINGSFAIMGYLKTKLATKPSLNFSYNQAYDFQKDQNDHIVLSSDFSFYIGTIPFDFTNTFTWEADSTLQHSGLVRHIFESDFGKNFTVGKNDWLEIKPAADYIYTAGPLYAKEKRTMFAASVTPRLKISDNFWLPITIKYDKKGWLGLLSVQYSLK